MDVYKCMDNKGLILDEDLMAETLDKEKEY